MAATALVLLYRVSYSPTIFKVLMLLDRLGVWIASKATSAVFPGDRIVYPGMTAATFFDIVLILVMGLQTALLGMCISLILNDKIHRLRS